MQKPIKFRAIIKNRNATIYFTLQDLLNDTFSNRELLWPWVQAGNQPDEFIDLKDKNGKEIYEGDIFRDNENIIREVKWDINCFTVPRVSWIVEVIGNINENPRLLKSEQKV